MNLFSLLLVVLALQAEPAPAPHDDPGGAYLDSGAAVLVSSARARSESVNREIAAYQMTARQRISAGVRTLRRDRLLFRRETAARVTWRREGEQTVEILGGRRVVPVALGEPRVVRDRDLASAARGWLFDPTGEWLLRIQGDAFAGDGADDDDLEVFHPLAPGSEQHYRFRSGETTTIRLDAGRTIRLIELQVIPRRSVPSLVSGSFWLDADSHSAVRGVFRLAAPFRIAPRIEVGGLGIPVANWSGDLGYLTVEYGLWEGRWWLPRLVALEGSVRASSLSVPMLYEQVFEDYQVVAEQGAEEAFIPPDTMEFRRIARRSRCDDEPCPVRYVYIPRDPARMLESEHLPVSIYAQGPALIGSREIDQLQELLRVSGRGQLGLLRPSLRVRPLDATLLRYNRVEGLAIGSSVEAQFGLYSARLAATIGHADRRPGADFEAGRNRLRGAETLGISHGLRAFSPEDRPFSLANTLSALAFGRDDGDYFRATGVSLATTQQLSRRAEGRIRLFAEQQRAAEQRTDWSLAGWRNGASFRPNPTADEANQLGAEAALRLSSGLDPLRWRGALELSALAETGTAGFVRPAMTAFASFPLPGPLVGALEVAGGTSSGDLTIQRSWWLGGPSTVRGFGAAERISGASFWRTRTEVATSLPAVRLVGFADAGWAGAPADLGLDPLLVSSGIGASFLDGLIRADLARALRGGSGWQLHLSVDAPL
jgi:hypothetical protein